MAPGTSPQNTAVLDATKGKSTTSLAIGIGSSTPFGALIPESLLALYCKLLNRLIR